MLDFGYLFLFGCCRFHFQFRFGYATLILFPSFYCLYRGIPLIVPIYFSGTDLSGYSSDDSSELVSHQMAHPSLCRTRFPS